jgi:phosphopantetheine adenylyltransferase
MEAVFPGSGDQKTTAHIEQINRAERIFFINTIGGVLHFFKTTLQKG